MARYIDAEKADVESISCFYGSECRIEDVQEWLDEQPTADVVEVVRCSECAYCAENICPITGHKMYLCAYHPNNYPVTLTHYCGHGERKVK